MSRCWLIILALAVGCLREPPPSFDTGTPYIEGGAHFMSGFTWVIDDALAGMPQPGARAPMESDLEYMSKEGVKLIVSANFEGVDPAAAAAWGIDQVSIPVPDFEAPSMTQMMDFVTLTRSRLDAGDRVAVHCTAGLGRTGTFLAVWFVADGMTADEAIAHVRARRPGSIETISQIAAIEDYASAVVAPRGTP